MLPADWLEYIAKAEKEIKRSPVPTKRHQPKIKRMQSSRQGRAESQTKNPIKAIYGTESIWNETPTVPNSFVGTKEVGPGDIFNRTETYRTGSNTGSRGVNYNKK